MSTARAVSGFLTRDSIANVIRLGSLVLIALGLFASVSGGAMVYLNLTAQLDLERSDRAASQQADRIAAELADIQTALRDASVVDAARAAAANGSSSNEALRQALRDRGVVSILDARLLPATIDAVALDDDSDLGFAATEVVIEAIREERAEIRVIEPGTPAESMVFAQRMPGNGGVLLLRLTVSVVTSLLRDDEMLDFVALAQRSGGNQTVLGATGRSAAARIHDIAIDGSGLVLQWSRAVVQAPVDNRAAVILGCSGVIVLMIGLLLRRRTRLARYLGGKTDAEAPETTPAAPAHRTAPKKRSGARRAQKTMVLDDSEARAQPEPPAEADEPPTVMAPAPDLPEWLRNDVDSGLEALDDETATLESTQPVPGGVFPDATDEADEELLEEFEAYQGVDPSLFRPDGIYGEAGKELAVPDMVIFGQAIGSEALHQGLRRICIGHDGRPSGPELLEGLAQGLSVCGMDVIELGATPAPIAWFAAHRMQQAGAVVVTGGNRPETINGLEIVFDGLWLGREERRTLLDRIRNQEFATGAGERMTGEEVETYRNQLAADHRLQRPLRVVVDCGNAVNGTVAQGLFESLEVDIIPLNADAETRADQVAAFDSPQRQQDLKLCVENFAADLGLAFDRVAGRLRVVGPDGRDLEMGRLAALLAADLAESGEADPVVVVDETLFEQVAGIDGVEFVPFKGAVHEMQQKLREREAAMAAAPDGTVCVARNWHGMPDALYAGAWLLAVLAADETPVAEKLGTGDAESHGGETSARPT